MIEYRSALKEDAAHLSLISNECGGDRWSEVSFLNEFDHKSIIECCDCDGKIVAFAVVSVSFDEGYLHLIAVDSYFRKQGIATKLLNHCEQLAKKRGVCKIILDVRISNNSAIKLYEKVDIIKSVRERIFILTQQKMLLLWVRSFNK